MKLDFQKQVYQIQLNYQFLYLLLKHKRSFVMLVKYYLFINN